MLRVDRLGVLLVHNELLGLLLDLAPLLRKHGVWWQAPTDLRHFAHSLLDLLHGLVVEVAVRGEFESLKLANVFPSAHKD